jgi:hypothetical protein
MKYQVIKSAWLYDLLRPASSCLGGSGGDGGRVRGAAWYGAGFEVQTGSLLRIVQTILESLILLNHVEKFSIKINMYILLLILFVKELVVSHTGFLELLLLRILLKNKCLIIFVLSFFLSVFVSYNVLYLLIFVCKSNL